MTIPGSKKQNHKLLDKLYNTYGKLIYRECYEILKDHHLAEDALNDTLIKVFNNIDKLDGLDSPKSKSFVLIVAKNTAINIYNKKIYLNNYAEKAEEEKASDALNPENLVIRQERINELSEIIQGLDEKYRDVLLLRHAYGMSREEIGIALGISTEAVKKRLQRGKAMAIEKAKKKGLYYEN